MWKSILHYAILTTGPVGFAFHLARKIVASEIQDAFLMLIAIIYSVYAVVLSHENRSLRKNF